MDRKHRTPNNQQTGTKSELVACAWLLEQAGYNPLWAAFVALYRRYGERWATYIQTHKMARRLTKLMFDKIVARATNAQTTLVEA